MEECTRFIADITFKDRQYQINIPFRNKEKYTKEDCDDLSSRIFSSFLPCMNETQEEYDKNINDFKKKYNIKI